MVCVKCGKEIDEVAINMFTHEGSDIDIRTKIIESDEEVVFIDTNSNWTGYELSETERDETITCPCCGKFPFVENEMQVYDVVRIVCFKK